MSQHRCSRLIIDLLAYLLDLLFVIQTLENSLYLLGFLLFTARHQFAVAEYSKVDVIIYI